eukprot:6175935-Pleurochrysis_carterae.AAC.6
MTQLDAREKELGLPSSCAALIDNPPPVRTPGFRGYFAGRPISFSAIPNLLPSRLWPWLMLNSPWKRSSPQ